MIGLSTPREALAEFRRAKVRPWWADKLAAELEAHLRKQNSGLPVSRLGNVTFSDSSKNRLVQLADLVAGAVRRSLTGEAMPLREIEDKMVSLQFWPPR